MQKYVDEKSHPKAPPVLCPGVPLEQMERELDASLTAPSPEAEALADAFQPAREDEGK